MALNFLKRGKIYKFRFKHTEFGMTVFHPSGNTQKAGEINKKKKES